jgi:hypothetical protein
VEVKIGVQYAARELVIESSQSSEQVEQTVLEAMKSEAGLLMLEDEKGRRVIVPVDRLAYVEIAEPSNRRVGFGAM